MKATKAVAASVSVLLVVGVCIGVIVGVTRKDGSGGSGDQISSTSKSVLAICEPTSYQQACVNSLSTVANNASATPKDFIMAAIQATIQEVGSALNKSGSIGAGAKDSTQKMAVEDCQDLLQFAVDELQASFSVVGDNDLHTVNDRVSELQNWLSAVISYQQTCQDGVTQPDLSSQINQGLLNSTQLTSNALAIVSAISGILTTFNIPINTAATSRRLLEESESVDGEFPKWFSREDRMLMAKQGQGKVTPNAVVAKDGSGDFKTIAAALDAYPKNQRGRYIIYVKAGVYDEYITVTKDQVNILMYGDGPRKTMVTGKKSNLAGITTMRTASFSVVGSGFIGKSMGFQNTAGRIS
ncbi:hypothetical protein MLD38_023631 [Melastoma candidum]|uniref:Uncharacterized protein n=1 Tax=Melastoma candidum TaxID=119954 RepID=A0ACB9NPS4_9MYRT|nr:hypothetical protein MLD38_023631 [Melastoma candidum]